MYYNIHNRLNLILKSWRKIFNCETLQVVIYVLYSNILVFSMWNDWPVCKNSAFDLYSYK